MKKTLLILSFLCFYLMPQAQVIQNGLVRELNSDRQPVAGVFIHFDAAVPTSSDAFGNFRLAFKGKKAGDLIFLNEVKKQGYELVNKKDLEATKIGNTDRLEVDIILAKAGVVDAAKKEYYEVSDTALLAGFEQEKRILRQQVQAAQLSEQEYANRLNTLQSQYDWQKASLDALAEKFARINFDDVGPIYEEALTLFKAGKIDKAIALLEESNLAQRTKEMIAEKERLVGAQAALDRQKKALEEDIKKQIETVRLLADMYNVKFDREQAESQYDQLLQLDSTNFEIRWEAAKFFKNQYFYEKAIDNYTKILTHPDAAAWQVANTHGHIGELYQTTGDLEKALPAFQKFFDSYQRLLQKDSSSSFYKENLAVSYSKLGETHISLGNLAKALSYFEAYLELTKELYEAYPSNVSFKNGLAISYEKLGSTHISLGDLGKALSYFERETTLFESLYETYPSNVSYKNGLAISYEKLGSTHISLGNLGKALSYFEAYFQLRKELYETYPSNVSFKNGLAISYEKLGETHRKLGDLGKALSYFESETILFESLYETYPSNVSYKNGLAISYSKLGETHISLGNLGKALSYFESETILFESLYETYPSNVSYKNGLAISYSKLGSTHISLGNLAKALSYFEADLELTKELYEAYPLDVSYKNGLAISYSKLGETHISLGNLAKALSYFEEQMILFESLYDSYPSNVSYKNGLAISYAKLGVHHKQQQNHSLAYTYFQRAEKLWQELTRDAPQFSEFQRFLVKVQREIFELNNHSITLLQAEIQAEKDTAQIYLLYGQLCDTIRARVHQDDRYKPMLAQSLNSRAWYGFFLSNFAQNEADIRAGLALQTDNKYLPTNLAPALLLQGQYAAAKEVYWQWKDQPFDEEDYPTYRVVFLEDLKTFEAAGIIPEERKAEVEQIRVLLME